MIQTFLDQLDSSYHTYDKEKNIVYFKKKHSSRFCIWDKRDD